MSLPKNIVQFFTQNYVVSLATCLENQVSSALCFYVLDEAHQRLIISSKADTQHAQWMLANPQVSGTVCGQPKGFSELAGIQFTAQVSRFAEGAEKDAAFALYSQRHAVGKVAKAAGTDLWALDLSQVKFTEVKLLIPHKTEWQRG